jgi:predicted phosphohydrolase
MKLYAIGDLHLQGGKDKPMDVFGLHWEDHPDRIRRAWEGVVESQDWVLLPGDISWAMRVEEMADDLAYLAALPGRKVLLRGNHDYWWQSLSKVRQALPEGVSALQNDYIPLTNNWAVCGTRGWELPNTSGTTAHDYKIYERELIRLRLSLDGAKRGGYRHLVAMLHFPPTDGQGTPSGFTTLLEEYGVEICVYGHLHGAAQQFALRGVHRGVHYHLVACDALRFTPLFLTTLD